MTEPVRSICDYPALYDAGYCCGTTPCSAEWERECDAEGGCWDRATCAGCDQPVWDTVKPLRSKASPIVPLPATAPTRG